MDDIASLGLRIDAAQANTAAVALDKMAAAGGRAETQAGKLSTAERHLAKSTGAAADAALDAVRSAKLLAGQQEAIISTANRLNAAHGSAIGSSKALTQATLGMTRQFADIGVSLAGGMNPLMILIQQGPQIADGFQMAASQGLGFKAVMAGLYAQAAPLLAVLGPIVVAAGAVGAVFALSARQMNEGNKNFAAGLGLTADQLEKVKNKTVTMGDVAVGTFNAAKGALAEAFGPQIDAAGKAIDKFFADMAASTVKETKAIVGGFMGAFEAVKATWAMLPAAFGDATISAAQAALDGLAKLINGAVGLINPLIAGMNERFKLDIPQLDTVKFAQLQNSYAGQMEATAKVGAAAFAKGSAEGAALVDKALAAIESESLKAAEKRIRSEAGKAKAIRDTVSAYEKAVKASQEYLAGLTEEVVTMGMSTEQLKRREVAMRSAAAPTEELARAIRIAGAAWEYQTGVMKAYEVPQAAVTAAANDNSQTMAQQIGQAPVFATGLENLITTFDTLLDRAYSMERAVDDIYYSIKDHNWAGAFRGLLSVISQLETAFNSAANAKDRVSAVAGIGMGVGRAVGGTAGAGISGAASGALAGAALVGTKLGTLIMPGVGTLAGAAIGAVLGGISSLFGSSSAKKKAKAEAAEQARQAEIARQIEIANQHRALEIALLEAQGKTTEALAARRADELAAMDASNRALAEQIYALQDAAEAKAKADAIAAEAAQKAADLAAKVADRRMSIQDRIDELTLTSADLTTKARAKEMAEAMALSDTLGPLLQRYYDLQDAANSASEAESAHRQALEASARATDAATAAQQRQAEAMRSIGDAFADAIGNTQALAQTLREFSASLSTGDLSGLSSQATYSATRSALQSAAANDNFAAIPELGRAFLAASKESATSNLSYLRDRALVQSLANTGATASDNRAQTIADLFRSLPGFASGGSLTIGGNSGVDQNVMSINDVPVARVGQGETVTVTPAGGGGSDLAAAVQEQNALLREQNALLTKIAGSTGDAGDVLIGIARGNITITTEAA